MLFDTCALSRLLLYQYILTTLALPAINFILICFPSSRRSLVSLMPSLEQQAGTRGPLLQTSSGAHPISYPLGSLLWGKTAGA
jgi:hypothetical protein